MPQMSLTHLEAAIIFAFFTSIVLGITTKRTQREQIRYGLYCFGSFLVALFGIAWLMRIGHG